MEDIDFIVWCAPFEKLFNEKDEEKNDEIAAWLAQMIEKSDLAILPMEVIENIMRFVPVIRTDAVIINDWVIVDTTETFLKHPQPDFRVYPLSRFREWEEKIDNQIKLKFKVNEQCDTVFGRVCELQDRSSRSEKVNNAIMLLLHSGNLTVESILEMTAERLKKIEDLEDKIDDSGVAIFKHSDGTTSTWPIGKQKNNIFRHIWCF